MEEKLTREAILDLLGRRDDVFFKLPFARYLLGDQDEVHKFSELLYLDHLFHWNSFFEYDPRKVGAADFLKSFQAIAQGFTARPPSFTPISRTHSGELAGGSHRLSLAMAGEQTHNELVSVPVLPSLWPGADWSFAFFRSQGMSESAILFALLEKSIYFQSENEVMPVLVVWPRAQEYWEQIQEKLVERFQEKLPIISFELSNQQLQRLVLVAYHGESWAENNSGVQTKTREVASNGSDTVKLVVLPPGCQQEIQNLKRDLRQIWGHEFQGVHSTNNWSESFRILSSFSNQRSLQVTVSSSVSRLRKNLEWASKTAVAVEKQFGEDRFGWAVSGSWVLGLLGIREAKDLDILFLSSSSSSSSRTSGEFSSHNEYLKSFGVNVGEIISNPELHFWFGGIKIISPNAYLSFIKKRMEGKDIIWGESLLKRRRLTALDSDLLNLRLAFLSLSGEPSRTPAGEGSRFSPIGAEQVDWNQTGTISADFGREGFLKKTYRFVWPLKARLTRTRFYGRHLLAKIVRRLVAKVVRR